MVDTNNRNFICPVHIAEQTFNPKLNHVVLVKFADFNPALYPDSITAFDKEAAKRVEAEKRAKRAAKRAERAAEQQAALDAAASGKEKEFYDNDYHWKQYTTKYFGVRDKPGRKITEVDFPCPQCEVCNLRGPRQMDETCKCSVRERSFADSTLVVTFMSAIV